VQALAPGLLDLAATAPAPLAPWGERKAALREALARGGWPRAGTVLVGDTWDERDWAAAARLAFYLPAERVFSA
jgi:hypothetical protein